MTDDRNYTDAALNIFVNDLDEGKQKMLRLAGALPATFKDMEPRLNSSDVARMIELAEDSE
jgi:hypothetical protein